MDLACFTDKTSDYEISHLSRSFSREGVLGVVKAELARGQVVNGELAPSAELVLLKGRREGSEESFSLEIWLVCQTSRWHIACPAAQI